MGTTLGKTIGIVLGLLVGVASHADTLDDLSFITEEYAPLNFKRDGRLQGIAVDTLEEVLKIAGADKTRQDFQVQPWARGYKTALEKKNTVLFSTTRTVARESLFKWVGPIVPAHIVVLAKKSRNIHLTTATGINQTAYTVAAVREDVAAQALSEQGVKAERIQLTNSGPSSARMLSLDRVDLWAYGHNEALWYLKELGSNPQDYEILITLRESEYYFALHREVDDSLVAKLQTALETLRTSGRLNAIVQRYLR